MINIFFFHAVLAPSGIILPIVMLALEVYLAWSYRSSFRPVLAAKAVPA